MAHAARAELESLLRSRKLDLTLTTSAPWEAACDRAATGVASLDEALHGGLRRGHVSEVVGARSSGRTSLLCAMFAAATARGEVVALIDASERFDPEPAVHAGVDLARLLWVRLSASASAAVVAGREPTEVGRALKATNLVLQAGGFGLVALDVADVPPAQIRQFPHTTWLRLARAVDGMQTVAVIVGTQHIGRSPGGVTIALDAPPPRWSGTSDRARLLRSVTLRPHINESVGVSR